LIATRSPLGLPVLRLVPQRLYALATTPAGPMGTFPLVPSHRRRLSLDTGRSAPASLVSGPAQRLPHYGLQTRQVAYATLYTRGFSSFVTSTTAPIATGRSEPVPGRDSSRCGPAPFTAHS